MFLSRPHRQSVTPGQPVARASPVIRRPLKLASRQLTATLLAGVYGVVALFGYGLHDLVHATGGCGIACSDAACLQAEAKAEASASVCQCGWHTSQEERQTTESSESLAASFQVDRPQHDPHSCGICSLLAKLRVSHGVADDATPFTESVCYVSQRTANVLPTKPRLLYDARGPPSAA